jgi:hypothetical protein
MTEAAKSWALATKKFIKNRLATIIAGMIFCQPIYYMLRDGK